MTKYEGLKLTLIIKGGTGLGLAISKGIVEEHGGEMWIDKEYTGGAKFMFSLPIEDNRI
ncbi:MAG TPA: ATP-binding protein [Nitrososphaeraceae archaeon]